MIRDLVAGRTSHAHRASPTRARESSPARLGPGVDSPEEPAFGALHVDVAHEGDRAAGLDEPRSPHAAADPAPKALSVEFEGIGALLFDACAYAYAQRDA
jgi:hypothetical protein